MLDRHLILILLLFLYSHDPNCIVVYLIYIIGTYIQSGVNEKPSMGRAK